MELSGKIIAVMPMRSGVSSQSGNAWASQDYVLEIPGQYPKKMLFNVFGEDRIKQFGLVQGAEVTVSFDIDAHEYNGKWFNQIRAFNIVHGQQQTQHTAAGHSGGHSSPAQSPQQAAAPFPSAPQGEDSGGSADDLPF